MEMITTSEAARRLGLSRQHVALLAQRGEIAGERVTARLYLLDPASVASYGEQEHKRGWPRGKPRAKGASDGE